MAIKFAYTMYSKMQAFAVLNVDYIKFFILSSKSINSVILEKYFVLLFYTFCVS